MAVTIHLDTAIGGESDDLAAQLVAAGVPAAVGRNPSELLDDPQLAHRGFFVPLNHTVIGVGPYDGLATIFSETPSRLRKVAPCLSEDTHYVLSVVLGLPEDEISQLADLDVLR